MSRGLSRKHFLRWAGAAGGGLALGAAGYAKLEGGSTSAEAQVEPFHGVHQAGIVNPQPKYLQFASLDVQGSGRAHLRDVMRALTQAAADLTAGRTAAGDRFDPALLTVTFGLGASVFDSRFGIAGQRPPALVDMPRFKGDRLRPELSDGDIAVQCCSSSREVVDRALHALPAAV